MNYEDILWQVYNEMCDLGLINEGDKKRNPIYFPRYTKVLRYIDMIYPFIGKKKSKIFILDIGGLDGWICIALTKMGFDNVSIADAPFYNENSYFKQRYMHYGIKTYNCELDRDLLSTIIDQNSFDLVICTETMEHFSFNPIPFVKDLRKLLRSTGGAIITVPNVVSLSHRITTLVGRSPTIKTANFIKFHKLGWNYSYHWHEYAMSELIKLFEYCGFRVEESQFWKGDKLFFDDFPSNKDRLKKMIESLLQLAFHFVPPFREKIFIFVRNL